MSFRNKAILWERVPALRVLVPLVAGIILYDQGYGIIAVSGLVAVCTTVLLLGIYAVLQAFTLRGWFPALLLQLLFVWMGMMLCYAGDGIRHPHWVGKKTDSSKQVMAVIRQPPQQKNYTVKMEVAAVALLGPGGSEPASGNALVYLYKTEHLPELNKGDTILLPNKWEPVKSSGKPFGLDYPQYCRRKNIHLQQFTDHLVVWGRQNPGSMALPEKLRRRSLGLIKHYIHDHTTAALLDAMLLGDERNIDPDMRQAYSDTGIIHIISISGAHIGILFLVLSYAFSHLGQKKNYWIKYGITVALIWFYIAIAGMPIPAIRAATMFTVLAAGTMMRRQHNPLNQLFVSAIIMLLVQPMWLFSVGFQLSFVAVLSLVLFYKPLLSLCPVKHKVPAFLVQSIAASIAAEVLVAPLVAYYFHSFPLMFIAANLLAGIAMSLILCLGMLLLVLGKISIIAQVLATAITAISGVFHNVVHILDKIDVPFFKTIFISPLLLIVLYLLIFSACLLRKSRAATWTMLCCLLVVSVLTFVRTLRVATQKRLIVFNEKSRAYAELLQGPYHHLLRGLRTDSNAVQLAHIGFGANKAGPPLQGNVLLINGQSIVLADSTTTMTAPFPTDILLVVSPVAASDTLLHYCTPRLVVCASGSRAELAKWEKACKERNVAFHSVRAQGAFIFP